MYCDGISINCSAGFQPAFDGEHAQGCRPEAGATILGGRKSLPISRIKNQMDKNKLLAMAEAPKFIEGIYNYCDRWCERCPLTSRCLTYAMSQPEADSTASGALNNEAFWKQIDAAFQLAKEMITDLAKQRGVDLEDFAEPAEMQDAVDSSPIDQNQTASGWLSRRVNLCGQGPQLDAIRLARHYGQMVNDWFDSHASLFHRKEDDLGRRQEAGLTEESTQTEGDSIIDAVEVIRWYQHQIFVKLMRASRQVDIGLENERENEELADLTQNDSDGSAKVALIGIERSEGAWLKLRGFLTDDAGSILSLLVHLDRLRRKAEEAFPQARSFRRPGFDTGTAPICNGPQ